MKHYSPKRESVSCSTLATPCTVAHQAPMSMEFPRQEYHSGLPLPSQRRTLCSPHLQETYVRVREVRQTNSSQPTQTPGQSVFKNQLFGRYFNLSLEKKAKNRAVGLKCDLKKYIKKPSVMYWSQLWTMYGLGFQVVLVVKNPPVNAGDVRDAHSIPGSRRSPGGGHGNPLQYSCLENPMDRGAWWPMVHRVAKRSLPWILRSDCPVRIPPKAV